MTQETTMSELSFDPAEVRRDPLEQVRSRLLGEGYEASDVPLSDAIADGLALWDEVQRLRDRVNAPRPMTRTERAAQRLLDYCADRNAWGAKPSSHVIDALRILTGLREVSS